MTDSGPERGDSHADAAHPERSDDLETLVSETQGFYRGQMDRITTWRTRMDQTTNWAVVVMAAILTFTFSSPQNPHYVLLIGSLSILVFLYVEAQRFQEYDAWRARIRALEANLYSEVYAEFGPENATWQKWLSGDLRDPTIKLPLTLAVGHRLQHVYLPLFGVMLAAWLLRISVFAGEASLYETAAIAAIPGPIVIAVVVLSHLSLGGLALWSTHHLVRQEFTFEESAERPTEES